MRLIAPVRRNTIQRVKADGIITLDPWLLAVTEHIADPARGNLQSISKPPERLMDSPVI
jgi:hypothetical protein